jgi:hypothetical protein
MNRIALSCLAYILLLVLLGGCHKDVSGSYLAADDGGVMWVQLVRTPDDHVAGQLVLTTLGADGKIEHKDESLTGAVNGENVTLIGGGFAGLGTATLSGTFDGSSLTLTGANAASFTLKRASLADYQAKLSDQATHSHAIITGRDSATAKASTLQAQKNSITHVDQVIGEMRRFDTDADVHFGRFPGAEKSYEGFTAKVTVLVTHERQIAGKPDRAVDRSELYVNANDASLNMDQLHLDQQSLQQSLQFNVASLEKEATSLEQSCRQSGPGTNLANEVSYINACNRLNAAAPAFHQKYQAMTAGLNHLEDVYKREKTAQERLLAEARKIE